MGQNTEIKEAGDKGSKTTVGESTCGLAGGGLQAWRMRRRVMQGVAQVARRMSPVGPVYPYLEHLMLILLCRRFSWILKASKTL
jgi:hypothetical protein